MKKRNLKFLFAAAFGLFLCLSNTTGQNLKNLVNKVTENETVKKTVTAITTDETVKSTVEAVKTSVQESINAKIDELKNPKPAAVTATVKAPAQALAPDVKNAISELRAFTGLTEEELNAKMKTLGFAVGTDDLALGGVVYKSKTAGYVLSVTMGTRNGLIYVRDVIKATVSKKANLVTAKTNFLKLGTQTADLKAQFTTAGIAATSTKGTKLAVQSSTDRTSKFLPALDKFTAKKENGTVTDAYAETDYAYELKLNQTTVKTVSTAITTIKVTDLTAEI
ncbi:MAG: hypothetical protein PHT07_16945 [Paludibacter sp.]|nr:hypothetical protein [Paludibacter sp.]